MAGDKVVGSEGLRSWWKMGLDFVLYSENNGEPMKLESNMTRF